MNEYWGGELGTIIREVVYNALRAYPNTMLDIINKTRTISKRVQTDVDETISEYGKNWLNFLLLS